jgi:hypothetical protein
MVKMGRTDYELVVQQRVVAPQVGHHIWAENGFVVSQETNP